MEKYTVFIDWKNQCSENEYTTQSENEYENEYTEMNENEIYYPKQSIHSMQSLSSYQWYFSEN